MLISRETKLQTKIEFVGMPGSDGEREPGRFGICVGAVEGPHHFGWVLENGWSGTADAELISAGNESRSRPAPQHRPACPIGRYGPPAADRWVARMTNDNAPGREYCFIFKCENECHRVRLRTAACNTHHKNHEPKQPGYPPGTFKSSWNHGVTSYRKSIDHRDDWQAGKA